METLGMEHTLAAAAEATGVAKSTIFRAIKSGKLSARRLEDGTFRIDASELARVYPPAEVERAAMERRNVSQQAEEGGKPTAARASETELAVLRVKLQAAEDALQKEREERERERSTIKLIENQLGRERDELLKRLEDERREAQQRLEEERDAAQRRLEEERQERREAQQKLMERDQSPKGLLARLLGR